jgi:hypothetical protein
MGFNSTKIAVTEILLHASLIRSGRRPGTFQQNDVFPGKSFVTLQNYQIYKSEFKL